MNKPWALYNVAEVFATIQGEATFTGAPSVFIRMQGCPVGCPWCDTRATWEVHEEDCLATLPMGPRIQNFNPKASRMTFGRLTAADLAAAARSQGNARHCVITGGEPLEQQLGELVRCLALDGFRTVQIETSGTSALGNLPDWPAGIWVTLSPKIGMPGGKVVLPAVVRRANEIKWPVGKQTDLDRMAAFLEEHEIADSVPVWLQPLSVQAKATALCVEAAQANGSWKVSVQTHKYLGLA